MKKRISVVIVIVTAVILIPIFCFLVYKYRPKSTGHHCPQAFDCIPHGTLQICKYCLDEECTELGETECSSNSGFNGEE